jgi:glutathione S-transferase
MTTQTTTPTLHHLESSQSHRILWALEELAASTGLTYNLIVYPRVHSQAPPSLKKIHPLGKSPILVVKPVGGASNDEEEDEAEDEAGEVVTESRLILQHLNDSYAQGGWTPSSERDGKRDAFFQEFGNRTLGSKVDFALIFDVIAMQMPFGLRQLVGLLFRPIIAHWVSDLQPVYQLMEDALSEEDAPWFSGARLGLADLNVSWPMDVAVARGYFDAAKFPKLHEWHNRVTAREAYKSALQKGGKYDLVRF